MFEDTKNLIFHNPEKMSKKEILEAVKSDDISTVCNTLVAAAFHEEDFDFCINLILNNLKHSCHDVRSVSIICIAHLARLHGHLPEDIVTPIILEALNSDNFEIRGRGIDVMDDLKQYIPHLWEKINDLHSRNSN